MEKIYWLTLICYCLICYAYMAACMVLKKKWDTMVFLFAPIIYPYEVIYDLKKDFIQASKTLDFIFMEIVTLYNSQEHHDMARMYNDLSIDEQIMFVDYCTEKQIVYKCNDIMNIALKIRDAKSY